MFSQLPAVFAGDRAEQGTDVVTHASPRVRPAETAADPQEDVVEFTVPGRVDKVVNHAEKLPPSPRSQFSSHSSEGRSGKTTPDMTAANYTPGDATDQAR
ncbi:hypothetical protein [Streptomyces sp. NPDC005930]|uniref:hypothetical protein n=1 Tax=Streptomyces sp. NPDC005930 TaxID=3364736 RepID=UPI0036BD0329